MYESDVASGCAYRGGGVAVDVVALMVEVLRAGVAVGVISIDGCSDGGGGGSSGGGGGGGGACSKSVWAARVAMATGFRFCRTLSVLTSTVSVCSTSLGVSSRCFCSVVALGRGVGICVE
eukprot:495184-Pleurochrysis_carterae.AAC.3